MYLLYEREVDVAIKAEQRRLLAWLDEAVRLNPDVSIQSVLGAADGYISSSKYQVSGRPAPEGSSNMVAEGEALDSEPADEHEDGVENAELESVDDSVSVEYPESVDVDDVDDVDDANTDDTAIEESVADTQTTEATETGEVYTGGVDYVDEPEQNLQQVVEDDDAFDVASLPSREELDEERAQLEEVQSKQVKLRDNHRAIFSDPSEIMDL